LDIKTKNERKEKKNNKKRKEKKRKEKKSKEICKVLTISGKKKENNEL
jgi:hypothetical protein